MTITTQTTNRAALRESILETVATARPALIELSHTIHGFKEISWEEHRSAAAVAAAMREAGFEVTEAAYGVETAVEAVYGTGELTVVICSEYDALPNVGHACGHNIIAAAGVGAALALKPEIGRASCRERVL